MVSLVLGLLLWAMLGWFVWVIVVPVLRRALSPPA